MAENDDAKKQNVETDKAAPAMKQQKARATRRTFLRQALVATSGVALMKMLPSPLVEAALQQLQCNVGQPLTTITEIKSNGTKLQAVLQVVDGIRAVPLSTVRNRDQRLRYYKGYNPSDSQQAWPPANSTAPGPGPTLRCSLGDDVQITFLNQVNVGNFPATAFSGDTGTTSGCDEGKTDTDPKWYPQTAGDEFPNCFHASSAANLHFHGTHVTPSTTGDNVLVNIWPDAKLKEADVRNAFKQVFDHCADGHTPQKWGDLPESWRNAQMGPQPPNIKDWPKNKDKGLIGKYDNAHPSSKPLWPVNYAAITNGEWPEYYIGSYPYCFKIPRFGLGSGYKMGQAPGTHWYHSHKHGSTALNMFNGMSGALIIEDKTPEGYDGKLNSFYNNNLKQQVLVMQQITGANNLLSSGAGQGGAAPPILVNGQFTPKITMQPGQIQLWRVINACVQKPFTFQFAACNTGAPLPTFKQTAQDGIQLSFDNYIKSGAAINVAPANRVDALVQAPNQKGLYVLGPITAPVLFLEVDGNAMPMVFPTERDQYPTLPLFLSDIPDRDIRLWRKVVYGWEKDRKQPFRDAKNAAPHYTIDGKQFEDGIIDQTMLLGSSEEWTIWNETSVAHPFHIHVNPYQIIEVFDPNKSDLPVRIVDPRDMEAAQKKYGNTKNLVAGSPLWWDNFAIPIAKTTNGNPNGPVILGPDGFAATPGYFIMRSRFVDFTGMYVQHCHILAHEDRGMMQLLEVVPNKTTLKHH